MATSPGRKFFDEHMAYIYTNKIDEMIDNQYTEDAVLISPFDVLKTPPPHIVQGRKALKEFFHVYLDWQGSIKVEKLYDFVETENSIFFQAIFTSKTGRWVVGDAWHMRGNQISAHYSFAYKADTAAAA
jgi:hypothetical protein